MLSSWYPRPRSSSLGAINRTIPDVHAELTVVVVNESENDSTHLAEFTTHSFVPRDDDAVLTYTFFSVKPDFRVYRPQFNSLVITTRCEILGVVSDLALHRLCLSREDVDKPSHDRRGGSCSGNSPILCGGSLRLSLQVRKEIVKAGQDTDKPNFGRK